MRIFLKAAGSVIAMAALMAHHADASEIAIASEDAMQSDVTPVAPPTEPTKRADINPYDRDIEITAPLQFNQRILGDLPVLLTRDDRFEVSTTDFRALIDPLLTPEAQAELATILGAKPRFQTEDVAASGIRLEYDPEQLAVLVLRIAPEKRAIEALYQRGEPEAPGDAPEPFSAFLNVNVAASRYSGERGFEKPEVFLNGAIRYQGVVFEADVQGRRDFLDGDYGFERRYARLIYDEPEKARRWFLGDLDPETRGRQGFVNLGGAGVVRQRQKFNAFRSNVLAGGRQLVLQEQATVRVMRNGIFQREFTLDPGQYDVSNLPLDAGSNDIQLEIEGISGLRQTVQYEAYLDTIDLEPGDYEFGAYVGILDDGGFGEPDYSRGKPVFTGFWRKAFLNAPAIGFGAQLSEDVQNITGQTQFILPNSGRLRLDAGLSRAKQGNGFAATVGYDQIIGGADGYDSFTVVADYTSRRYTNIGGLTGVIPISWNLAATYTKRFTNDLFATANASYRISRSALIDDSYNLSATANYRYNKQLTFQVGVEYSQNGLSSSGIGRDGFGVTFGIVWQPRYNRRAEARYNSAKRSGSARFQQSVDNRVGSFGYSLATNYDDGPVSASGQVDYVGNRFDVSLSHTAFGQRFNSFGDEQITTLRVGSSIAYAGGHVAVGRTINDSFAVVYPHKTLDGRPVIVGEGLEGGGYVSKSGAVGAALQNTLTSYLNQSVSYDVADPPRGYDIGDGIKRVTPAYKSGYAIEVGSAAFVSAIGTLHGTDGQPLKLVSGVLRRTDAADAREEPFFTNTAGRFAIAKLEPGAEYSVEFYSGDRRGFTFKVPEDNKGLLDLGIVGIGRREGQ
ncbi:hypothetical protein [Sphingopyxis sp. JAI128]|uniref:hypothetical protein n=1 Tax=Sphingopyxis sp. JAI128 TaxID=2723066 RepID=UPI0016084637|nr:hypothetical protein [Sphingopyxis sp. JAI128]MBB6427630.1 outer membrane usher protein [Sphingopyxis sp. JAI128]